MPKRDSNLLIEDISTAIARIDKYTTGLNRERFLEDDKTIDAVVRNLEIIGEASRHLPEAFKERHTSIPWHQIVGLRNRVVHDYFGVDLELIWQIVTHELPSLKNHISSMDQ